MPGLGTLSEREEGLGCCRKNWAMLEGLASDEGSGPISHYSNNTDDNKTLK